MSKPEKKVDNGKKLVSFKEHSLINRIVGDEAIRDNCSGSAVIEKHLLDSLLPRNKFSRFLAKNVLYSDNGSIRETLGRLFDHLSTCDRVADSDVLMLLQYLDGQESYQIGELNEREGNIRRFISQLELICVNIENPDEVNKAREYLHIAKSEPQKLQYKDLYFLVLDNWNYLKKKSCTYRMLSELVYMKKDWKNTPETRLVLLKILKTVEDE